MKIAVFGLGYVGIVSAACLARDGHEVIGVDPQPTKVELVNGGKPPIIEKNVGELVAEAVEGARLESVAHKPGGVKNPIYLAWRKRAVPTARFLTAKNALLAPR